MATVYLADEVKHGRPVAIKVLKPDVGVAAGPERFLREIGIAARLSHPHLVPLLDSGEAHGLLYYVSAYIPGGSLRDRLRKEGRIPVADAVRITSEIGAALDYAHRAGFVHRDVKPENILFADGHALLADFGIARACSPGREERVTEIGFALGTPQYMSPEQASGESTLDGRSDVYSLACVSYEMLTGQPPFVGGAAQTIMARHLTETPRRVRTIAPDVPASIEAALMRALAKDPSHRFPTVTSFIDALTTDRDTGRVAILPATRSVAVLPFVNTSGDPENEYLSDGITDELIDALAKVEGIRVASRTSVFALKGKPQDVRAIGALLDCTHVLEGTMRRIGQQLRVTAQLTSTTDGQLIWSQRYDRRFDDVFAIQDELARTIVDTLRATSFADLSPEPLRRHSDDVRAYREYLKGRYEWNRRTQDGVVAGIKHFENAIAIDPNYALAYTGLADSYALGNDYRSVPVAEGFEAAKHYARRAIELDDSLAEAHASLAWVLFIYDWDWDAAEREYRRAISLDPRYASAHQWYAFLLVAKNAMGDALVEAHTAVELDPSSVSVRRTLGGVYWYARRYDQARYHLERALAMNPTAEETYRQLGLVLGMSGELEDAKRVLFEAMALPDVNTYTRSALAYVFALGGERREAQRILDELERHAAVGYVSPVAFATIHLGLGEVEKALDWTERAYEERRGWLAYVRVHPMMDPMRGHPRFDALVKKMRWE
jgi:serine/threonine-protein kinase